MCQPVCGQNTQMFQYHSHISAKVSQQGGEIFEMTSCSFIREAESILRDTFVFIYNV